MKPERRRTVRYDSSFLTISPLNVTVFHMINLYLIQSVGRNVFRRLLQIPNPAGISVQLDDSFQAIRSQHAFPLLHTDPFQDFRQRIPGKNYLLFFRRISPESQITANRDISGALI